MSFLRIRAIVTLVFEWSCLFADCAAVSAGSHSRHARFSGYTDRLLMPTSRQPAYRFSDAFSMRPGLSLTSAMRYGRFKGPASGQIQGPQTTPATAEGIQPLVQKPASHQEEAPVSWLDCALAQALTFGKCAEALGGGSGSTGSGSSSSGSKSKSPLSGQGVMSGMSPAQEQMPNQPAANQQMPGQPGNMANAPGKQGVQNVPGMMSPMSTPKGQEVGAFGVVRPGWSTLKPGPVSPGPKSAAAAPMANAAQLPPTPGLTANQPPPPGPAGAMPLDPNQPPPAAAPGAMPPAGSSPLEALRPQRDRLCKRSAFRRNAPNPARRWDDYTQ
jgi:hypothetical protein